MRAIYGATTEGAVAAAAAATAKTIFGVKGDTGHGIDLQALAFSLDGLTASEKPVLVEFCAVTFATNAPGTNSTAVTVDTVAGPRVAETFAAGKNWTAEPTVVTVLNEFEVDPYKFIFDKEWPLGNSPDFAAAEGFGIRLTVPTGGAAVNLRVNRCEWSRV